jgi:hypothetical protein
MDATSNTIEAVLLRVSSVSAKEMKKNKLMTFVYSVLRDPLYQQQLAELIAKLSLNEQQVIQSYLDYGRLFV